MSDPYVYVFLWAPILRVGATLLSPMSASEWVWPCLNKFLKSKVFQAFRPFQKGTEGAMEVITIWRLFQKTCFLGSVL